MRARTMNTYTIYLLYLIVVTVAGQYPAPSHLNITLSDKERMARMKNIDCIRFEITTSTRGQVFRSQPDKKDKYKGELSCMNFINAPFGKKVKVTFISDGDIEESEDCKYDALTFQDGPFEFSPVIKKLCGHIPKGTHFISSTNYMRVTFVTDDSIQGAGFNLTYRIIDAAHDTHDEDVEPCYYYVPFSEQGTVEISSQSVRTFYTKNGKMLKNIDCVWDIHNVDNTEVFLWVDKIVQPNLISCDHRRMMIYAIRDKMYEDFTALTHYDNACFLVKTRFYPGTSRLFFHLTSLEENVMPMIRLNFTSYKEPQAGPDVLCNASWYTCEDGRLCLHMNLVCNGLYNCPDGDDESETACALKNGIMLPGQTTTKDGSPIGLQFIFVGAAIMFFVIVTAALIISARRMIKQNRDLEERKKCSTIIMNRRPSRLFQQSTFRKLIEPLQDTTSHESASQCSRLGHCPHSARNSIYSKRGSWFLNGSVSNLSISSTEPKAKNDNLNPSPSVSPVGLLTPDLYTNPLEQKRLRAAST